MDQHVGIDEVRGAERRSLDEILRDWLRSPCTLSVTQGMLDDLLRRFHHHQPTFGPQDLKKLPTTGKGLLKIPNRFYDKVVFRNLLNYNPVTNDFSLVNDVLIEESTNDETQEPDINSDDSSSSIASSEDLDDADDDSDYVGGDATPLVLVNDHGVEAQLDFEEQNKKGVQDMAYLGIENVLCGRNPGVVGDCLLENALRAICASDKHALSDAIVDRLFEKENVEVNCRYIFLTNITDI